MNALNTTLSTVQTVRTRLSEFRGRVRRFYGAYDSREAALAALRPDGRRGYDTEGIAEVSFEAMCRLAPWDYPVLFWLQRLSRDGARLVDAGGHMGTKYIAFKPYLPLEGWHWTVLDLPAVVSEARARQAAGRLPVEISFETEPGRIGEIDILIASGLLQYLDVPFSAYLDRLATRPKHVVLNKVAMHRAGPLVTLERIGATFVPYTMRNRADFESEIAKAGYRVLDCWEIPELAHRIPTNPRLGASQSLGYVLESVI
jgi:putative methyltransferase (TIGR04325 family)